VGRRIAFDPRRGRLWAVCPSCDRWNLAPLDSRWEALEELERKRRDQGRVLATTANVALIHVPGVELVRVGQTRLLEEAWWRYGKRLRRRPGRLPAGLLRWQRFGFHAWRGHARCITCDSALHELSWRRAGRLHLTRDGNADPALHLQCGRCRRGGRIGEFQLEGVVADHVLRRVMTYSHFGGASDGRIQAASDLIDRLGSPAALATELSGTGLRLDALLDRRTQAVALDIALNEDSERRLLGMELAELEARWRAEEEIAGIADGLLTPLPSLDHLLRRLRPGDRAPNSELRAPSEGIGP